MIATLNNIPYSEKSWYTNYVYYVLVLVQGYNIRAITDDGYFSFRGSRECLFVLWMPPD